MLPFCLCATRGEESTLYLRVAQPQAPSLFAINAVALLTMELEVQHHVRDS